MSHTAQLCGHSCREQRLIPNHHRPWEGKSLHGAELGLAYHWGSPLPCQENVPCSPTTYGVYCHAMVQLFRGGLDLAERREMQGCQSTVEHIPHCSQQLEACKHLVKEMREWLP